MSILLSYILYFVSVVVFVMIVCNLIWPSEKLPIKEEKIDDTDYS